MSNILGYVVVEQFNNRMVLMVSISLLSSKKEADKIAKRWNKKFKTDCYYVAEVRPAE